MEKEQSNSIQQSLYINGTSSRTPKDTYKQYKLLLQVEKSIKHIFGVVNTAELRFGIFLHVPPNYESSYLKFSCSIIKCTDDS